MRFISQKRRHAPAVIIIALIDVLIVMLIFMMATTTVKQQPAIKISLPESAQKPPKLGTSEPEQLVVTIAKDEPHFYLGQHPVTLDKLVEELTAAVQKNPRSTVSIRPDGKATLDLFVMACDAAEAAGIRSTLGIQTKRPSRR